MSTRKLATVCVLAVLMAAVGSAPAATVNWKGITWTLFSDTNATVDANDNLVIQYTGADEYSTHPEPGVYVRQPDPGWDLAQGPWFQFDFIEPPVIDDGQKIRQCGFYLSTENSGDPNTTYYWADVHAHAKSLPAMTDDYCDSERDAIVSRSPGQHTVLLGWRPNGKSVDLWLDGLLYDTFTNTTAFPLDNVLYTNIILRTDGSANTMTFTDYQDGYGYVPEPVTLWLVGIGALALLRRRR